MRYAELISAVNQIVSGYTMPLTLRQVYYRLVAGGLIGNTRSTYTQLSSQLVTARENGDIGESRIADRSRRIDDVSFDSPEGFLAACRSTLERRYLHRFWDSQPAYCEVWVEKDALSQVLADAVYPFNTIVAPSRGYSSYTYIRDASARIRRYCPNDKPAVILHFADHDPSGIDMSRDLQQRLAKFGAGMSRDLEDCRVAYSNVDVQRVALTYEQVQQYNLIPNPAKMADTRVNGYISKFGSECWELDAIPPDELVRLCREAVDTLIQERDAWLAIKEQDKVDRETLMEQIEGMTV